VPRSAGGAAAVEQGPPRRAHLRLVEQPRLRVVDVALFYGDRSGGIRTYLDAKRAWAAETGACEHHVLTPHDVPSFRFATPNGYRVPVGVGALKERLRGLEPDVVLLHDPFWGPLGVSATAHEVGARVVAVHHGSVDLSAASLPLPGPCTRPLLRRWLRHAYRDVEAVMSAVPTWRDIGVPAELKLRFGLEEAFRPRPEIARGDHVLYAGRLALEKGVLRLVDAAARSRIQWPLRIVGTGPLREAVLARARQRGVAHRVTIHPFVDDREELARTYAGARVVVMPGEHETFGLVGFEAAASGARVVCCTTAPSASVVGRLAHTFGPGDAGDLAAAIDAAYVTRPDHDAARALIERSRWPAIFARELEDLTGRFGLSAVSV
jgi:alpha-1,6-mannosyltransferase